MLMVGGPAGNRRAPQGVRFDSSSLRFWGAWKVASLCEPGRARPSPLKSGREVSSDGPRSGGSTPPYSTRRFPWSVSQRGTASHC